MYNTYSEIHVVAPQRPWGRWDWNLFAIVLRDVFGCVGCLLPITAEQKGSSKKKPAPAFAESSAVSAVWERLREFHCIGAGGTPVFIIACGTSEKQFIRSQTYNSLAWKVSIPCNFLHFNFCVLCIIGRRTKSITVSWKLQKSYFGFVSESRPETRWIWYARGFYCFIGALY